jgi:hypothetical protein
MASALLKADKVGLNCAAQKDGTLRVGYSGWDDVKVLAEGEVLEVRNIEGQAHAFRRVVAEPIDYRALLIAYMADVRAGVGGRAGSSSTTGCYWGPARVEALPEAKGHARQRVPEADIFAVAKAAREAGPTGY